MNKQSRLVVPKLKEILEVLDEMAPFSLAEDWDNSGLQVGYFSQEVRGICMALDPTIKAVRYASKGKAQLLLTHHPLIFKPLSNINPESYPGDVINEALKKKVSIVAAHTNLDATKGGISDMLADLFGLQDVEALYNKDASGGTGVGMGRIGNLPEPLTLSEMVKAVKNSLGTEGLMVRGLGDMEIGRVAVVGGSGGGMVSLASKKGADLLVTGDIRHHEALEAEALGLALIDGGHFQTERAAFNLFADHFGNKLKERGWDIIPELYEDEKEPMRHE
ncbi:Nif3-like dinuclear metal center hexameric protein [Thermodesulfobacteriota bacterium]